MLSANKVKVNRQPKVVFEVPARRALEEISSANKIINHS